MKKITQKEKTRLLAFAKDICNRPSMFTGGPPSFQNLTYFFDGYLFATEERLKIEVVVPLTQASFRLNKSNSFENGIIDSLGKLFGLAEIHLLHRTILLCFDFKTSFKSILTRNKKIYFFTSYK